MKRYLNFICTVVLTIFFLQVQAQIPTKGLVGWWPFTGNAIDSFKMLNNGTVNGAVLTTDRFGVAKSAYLFNGTNSSIDVGTHASLRSSTLSINFWFKYSDTTVDMFMVNNANYSSGFYGINCRHQVGGGMMMDVATGSSKRMMAHRSFNRWADNKWHMYTGIYEKNSDVVAMYIDGVLSGYKNWDIAGGGFLSSDSVQYRSGEHWYFGAASQYFSGTAHNGPSYFKGSLDDIRFYNRPLAHSEIRQLLYEKTVDTCLGTKVIHYDTSYVNIYDTTFTNIYDSIRVNVFDTTLVYRYDTIEITRYDTIDILRYDTIQVTRFDTTFITRYDTVIVSVADTLKIYVAWSSTRQNFNMAKIYPNPTNDKVVIDFGDYLKIFGHKVFINDATGKQVYDGTVTSKFMEVDLKSIGKSGTYLLVITDKQLNVLTTKHIILY